MKIRPTLVTLILLILGVSVALGKPGNGSGNKVDAGPDQTVILPAEAILDGTVRDVGPPNPSDDVPDDGQSNPPDAVSDDGSSNPPGALTTSWTQVPGPETVTFADASAVDTHATFSAPGTYVLRLTANDGASSFIDELTVTVNPQVQVPADNPPPPEPAQQPGNSSGEKKEKKEDPQPTEPSSTSTEPSSPSTDESSTSTETSTLSPSTSYPPPSTERSKGVFGLRCLFSHLKQVDPIVVPGPSGTPSAHMHDFFGNRSTDSDSTYASMIGSGTTCDFLADTAGYWVPSLVAPGGSLVKPVKMSVAYRNDPISYGTTVPFPADFRVIAGGMNTYPHFFWNCAQQSSSTKLETPPACGSDRLIAHIRFPNCWNGASKDSSDHRSHVVYPVKQACPATHPVKLPFLALNIYYPGGESGSGYRLSDGTLAPHADFWNTWQQTRLEGLVHTCLNAGIDCGLLRG